MYKANHSGSAAGKSGIRYSWDAGKQIEAPKGELDHVEGLEWVEAKKEVAKEVVKKSEPKAESTKKKK